MNSTKILFMLILLLFSQHSVVIDGGSGRIHPHTQQIEGLAGESGGRDEKAEARNHTHSSIRHKHHHRDHEKADVTTAASDRLSPVFLAAAATTAPVPKDVSKMGSRLKHHHDRRPGEQSADDHRERDVSDQQRDLPPSGRSPGDQSPASSSADVTSKEYILHVPPLNPLLHLHHHHPEHHQHHDHNASHRYPSDYHQMLHYNAMRNKPNNVSLVVMQWSPPAVRVSWHFNESEHGVNMHTKVIPKKLEAFRLTYHPTNSRYRLIQEVSPVARNVTLSNLKGNTEYLLKIFPIFRNELIGAPSHTIRFISPDDGLMHTEESRTRKWGSSSTKMNQQLAAGRQQESTVHTEEIIIVFIIIMIWMSFILLFIKKWGRIRTLEPQCFLPKELLQGVAAPDLLVPSAVAAVTASASGTAAAAQSLINGATGAGAASLVTVGTNSRVNNSCAIIYNNINNSSHKPNNNLRPFAASTAVLPAANRPNRFQRMAKYCSSRDTGSHSTQSLGKTCGSGAQVKSNNRSSEWSTNSRHANPIQRNEDGEEIVTSGCADMRAQAKTEETAAQLIDCTLHRHDSGSGSDMYDLLNDRTNLPLIQSPNDRTTAESERSLSKASTKGWRGTSCQDWQQYCDVAPSDLSVRICDHLLVGRKVFRSQPSHEKVDFHAENDEASGSDAIPNESVDQVVGKEEENDEVGGEVGAGKILAVDRMYRSTDDLMGTLLHQDRRRSLLPPSASIERRRGEKRHPVSSSAPIDVKQDEEEKEM